MPSVPSDPNSAAALRHCLDRVRAGDPDRYFATLFAPADLRGDLVALYAFNLELERIPRTVSEPLLGQIRLQWWREAVAAIFAGRMPGQHEVLATLVAAIQRRNLPQALLERLIDTREMVLAQSSAGLPEISLFAEADGTDGALTELALGVAGAGPEAKELAQSAGRMLWAARRLRQAARSISNEETSKYLIEACKEMNNMNNLMFQIKKQSAWALLPVAPAAVYLKRLQQSRGDPSGARLQLSPIRRQIAILRAAWLGISF
jgi:NADH dehydrogenase [ubiquinone] 1 alpha subcomplex assembly factor 6